MNNATDINNFNRLFNEYYKRFIRFAMGYIRDEQVAEDFVSDAFAIFWENRNNLAEVTNPQAYILTIVRNKCLNHLKHVQVKNRYKDQISKHAEWRLKLSINTLQACDPNFIFSEEIEKIVSKTLDSLPAKTREVFLLSRFQEMTYKEIADKMNLSTKSIEYHISRALEKFRISLKDFVYLIPLLFLLK